MQQGIFNLNKGKMMDVVCQKCLAKFKIPDEKIPKGQSFSLPCPQCENKVFVDSRDRTRSSSFNSDMKKENGIIDEVDAGTYDASDKPFDFVEEGVETALLCEPDAAVRAKIITALYNMGYHTTAPLLPKDALKQMRFHVFDMIVLNERFGTRDPNMNNVLKYLDRLNMSIRRNIFVTLVTTQFRTMDNMGAFHKSVNLIINLKNINEIEKILRRGKTDYENFYRVYKQSLIKTGRI
ncbi:MAG: zinc-ribbon domain-containing protein [Deltaproteobacteria bacterium]|nr:zinc-ribbon domain-containing protein [Deltaproteobacteria bacterium]MBW1746885.1 zinc-ribbon domain-containing protein [Deltaproteobacteria bacterium]MBW1825424.1 zinc-ribbon domain-containing protein [Deltaproteobacteria bacterium]MBW1967874.1 zinc-ribbon domain-containing protein [Deltaproteobacteria bacterium]MBW2155387.1 zinc-ribbon domain-containing protein [Deltaproteobacteria bacterium]